MSRFIESLRLLNGDLFHLDLHQQRVTGTFRYFSARKILYLEEILKDTVFPGAGLFKIRIVYDLQGRYEIGILPYELRKIGSFALVEVPEVNYAFKYEDREIFQRLKSNASAEEIIITQNGFLTDTSYSNLVFLKNGAWFTPKTCLLNGVQRQFLLQSGEISEAAITLNNVHEYSHFKLINALNGLRSAFCYSTEMLEKSINPDI